MLGETAGENPGDMRRQADDGQHERSADPDSRALRRGPGEKRGGRPRARVVPRAACRSVSRTGRGLACCSGDHTGGGCPGSHRTGSYRTGGDQLGCLGRGRLIAALPSEGEIARVGQHRECVDDNGD